MRPYSTPIVIFTWAEAAELPAQRAQLVRVSLGDLVVDGDPAVPLGRNDRLAGGQHPRYEPLDELDHVSWSSVCRWTEPDNPSSSS